MKNSKKIKHIHCFDCDGVLLDSSHRYRTVETKKGKRIDLAHWRENEKFASEDKPLKISELYRKLVTQKNTFVIIATSRILKPLDLSHIDIVLGLSDAIVSRSTDNQKGFLLKINGIQRIVDDFNLHHVDLKNNLTIYEDNIEYLKNMCDFFDCKGIYIPSNQGH